MSHFITVIPILRIFDLLKAEEFYQNFLGFSVDWSHRFGDDFPIYRQISRDGLVLQLSEHHGDAIPGSHVRVMMTGIREYHQELSGKQYKFARPGLEESEASGMLEVTVSDPFGNRITFAQARETKT